MELSFEYYEGDVLGNVYSHLIAEKYYYCNLPKFSSSVVFSCNGQMIKQDFVMQIDSRGKSLEKCFLMLPSVEYLRVQDIREGSIYN